MNIIKQNIFANDGKIDPITLEVLWTRLISAVDEAALTLHRTSFSTVVRESHDYTCMLLDTNGRAVAQASRSIPSFIGTLPMTVKAFLQKHPADTLSDGDVLICNDPWIGTGHLPDLTLAAPLFRKGKIIGFAGAIAHMSDIGGRRRSPDNREIYEEGLQIPILKIYESGNINSTLVDIICRNVRVPDEVLGDIHAMVGSCERMRHSLDEMLEEYDIDNISILAQNVIDRANSAMIRAINKIPNGSYTTDTWVDSLDADKPLLLRCRVDIHDDKIIVDFDGSSAQNDSPLNAVIGYTTAYTSYAIKCVLLPDVPNNEGVLSPIEVRAPYGSCLNVKYPAAVEARATIGHYSTSAVLNSLSLALPDKVPAESGIPLHGFTINGRLNDDKPFSGIFFFNGGQGARPGQDGISTLSFPTNVSNTPVEILERNFPLLFWEKTLLPRSAGEGKFRGGFGQRVVMEVTEAQRVSLSLLSQRLRFPPLGRQGGENGSCEKIELNGTAVQGGAPFEAQCGDVFVLELPGGGGFGSKAERDEALVKWDQDNYSLD